MYADRVEAETQRTVKERLNGNSLDYPTRRQQVTGKRLRQDDKWEHDLYEDGEPQASNSRVGARDLRLKLQRKSLLQASGKESLTRGRDLREKLSGINYAKPLNTDLPKPKPEAAKTTQKNVAVEGPASDIKKVAKAAPKNKASLKNDTSVDDFLQSLGLEKYSITFQAEEVDMAALVYMVDEDLKALGIPMGPRKKILLALESRV